MSPSPPLNHRLRPRCSPPSLLPLTSAPSSERPHPPSPIPHPPSRILPFSFPSPPSTSNRPPPAPRSLHVCRHMGFPGRSRSHGGVCRCGISCGCELRCCGRPVLSECEATSASPRDPCHVRLATRSLPRPPRAPAQRRSLRDARCHAGMPRWDAMPGCHAGMLRWDATLGCYAGCHAGCHVRCLAGMPRWDATPGCHAGMLCGMPREMPCASPFDPFHFRRTRYSYLWARRVPLLSDPSHPENHWLWREGWRHTAVACREGWIRTHPDLGRLGAYWCSHMKNRCSHIWQAWRVLVLPYEE